MHMCVLPCGTIRGRYNRDLAFNWASNALHEVAYLTVLEAGYVFVLRRASTGVKKESVMGGAASTANTCWGSAGLLRRNEARGNTHKGAGMFRGGLQKGMDGVKIAVKSCPAPDGRRDETRGDDAYR